jgi:NTP pyrophosphatase (non-canonical NTP hydrolase)
MRRDVEAVRGQLDSGLTPRQIADRLGFSWGHVNRIAAEYEQEKEKSKQMTPSKYQQLAERTESMNIRSIAGRVLPYSPIKDSPDPEILRLLHMGIGVATEGGEFLDMLKKHIFYGKPLDRVNLAEEIGDLMWYIAGVCNAMGLRLEDVMSTNIAKLAKRYPEKFTDDAANRFTEEAAINRDLDIEREVLDKLRTY